MGKRTPLIALLSFAIVACTTRPPPPLSIAVLPVGRDLTPSPEPTLTATAMPTRTPTPLPETATVTPTVLYSPVPTPTNTPTPPAILVWESTISLSTYGWEQALLPTGPEDPIYPYARLNFEAVTGPVPREYRALYVQNDTTQLVVLPDMGGRILRWVDLTSGHQLLYANPVIKPTRWGYRGWWFATGGMEWAFPTDEHGLNEYRPWEYQFLWNGVRVWDTDDRSGLMVEVTIQLEADTNRMLITPRISNPTDQPQSYQFWTNAMLTLSATNAPSPHLTFVLPASEVQVHSTGDGTLPDPGGRMTWPVHAGRDFSRYPEWHSFLGVFAPQAAASGYAGAYDLEADLGLARIAPTWVRGVKLFCLGGLGADRWTDDESRYFELWGGLLPTFWDYTTIEPGESVAWTEYWYALSGMGGYNYANSEAAVRLMPVPEGVELALQTVRPLQVTVILREDGVEVTRWETEVGPGEPFQSDWGPGGGPWGVGVFGPQGEDLIQFGP